MDDHPHKMAKSNFIRQKHVCQGVWLIAVRQTQNHSLEPVVRIRNNLVEVIIGLPSTAKSKTNLIRQNRGRQGAWPVSLVYICKKL